MSAIEPSGDAGVYRALASDEPYRKCENYAAQGVCNWMIRNDDETELCRSCRLNRIIPDLNVPENRERWGRIEMAKRHLLYNLFQLRLPVTSRQQDAEGGLAFDFKSPTKDQPVLTGHADGVITLNLAEADPVAREEMRVKMKERYRTLLGHFRHEVGHYFWSRLIEPVPERLARFRELFGDDRQDYAEALKRHYAKEANAAWADDFISEYASAHPWEDWAETWAHYLHMVDTFETAQHFGLVEGRAHVSFAAESPFDTVLANWMQLTVALNALNRSMGLPDPYPFDIGQRPGAKLGFVHQVATDAAEKPDPKQSGDGFDVDRNSKPVRTSSEHDSL